jgi:tetratricopeptide (TPR) repeat protein
VGRPRRAYERRHRWVEAEAAYDRAIALNPRYATAHQWRAWLLAYLGRHDEALAGIGRVLALEPMSLIINTNFGEHLLNLHRHEDALFSGTCWNWIPCSHRPLACTQ